MFLILHKAIMWRETDTVSYFTQFVQRLSKPASPRDDAAAAAAMAAEAAQDRPLGAMRWLRPLAVLAAYSGQQRVT